MAFPTYMVNGVPMLDPHGRWHEHEEMSVLPAHPGLRMGTFHLGGMGGETRLPQAPVTGQDFNLHMVVNAVNAFGKIPSSRTERLRMLQANASELFRVLGISAMTQGTTAVISRYMSATDFPTQAFAVLEASAEPDFEPGGDHATYRFFFRILSGVWRGPTRDALLPAGTTVTRTMTQLAACTAPIDDPLISLRGPFTWLQVTNQRGNGFRYSKPLTEGQAVTVDTVRWQVSAPYVVAANASYVDFSLVGAAPSPELASVGQASGVALTLLPETNGAPVRITGAGRSPLTAVHISTREAYL